MSNQSRAAAQDSDIDTGTSADMGETPIPDTLAN
jgi:hypothetical protein